MALKFYVLMFFCLILAGGNIAAELDILEQPSQTGNYIDNLYIDRLKSIKSKNKNINLETVNGLPIIFNYLLESEEPSTLVLDKYEMLGGEYDSVFIYANGLCQYGKLKALSIIVDKGFIFTPVTDSNLIGIPSHCLVLSIDSGDVKLFDYIMSIGKQTHGTKFIQTELLGYIERRINELDELK